MGLFDGFEAGWNSFKNKELKQVGDWAVSVVPESKKKEVVDWVKEDPIRAAETVKDPLPQVVEQITAPIKQGLKEITQPIWERESTKETLGEDGAQAIKETIIDKPKEAIEQGLKETTQPIWERESTKETLGEDGADKLQDTLNPARWAENTIDRTPLSPEQQEKVKKYLPAAAIAAGALILLSVLKG